MIRYILYTSFCVLLLFCSSPKKPNITDKEKSVINTYATGFEVYKNEGYIKIIVKYNQQEKTYVLINSSQQKPKNIDYDLLIQTPIQSIATLSSIHTAFLEALGQGKSVVGIDNINYHKSKSICQRFTEKKIVELGDINQINKELLLQLNADVVMTYPTGTKEEQLEEIGIPIIINAEHLEDTPLGRTEWIKFMGYFYEKEEEATQIFNEIHHKYNQEKQKSKKNISTIFSGKIYQDTWYISGGKSYISQLLQDAGFEYIWKADSTKGSLPLAKENAFIKAKEADFWFLQVFESNFSYHSLVKENSLYRELKSVKNNHLIYVNTVEVDYYGRGVLEPYILLQDLNKIQKGDTSTVYYHLLK